MARWQELHQMLLDKKLTPEEIVDRLDVCPSRLDRLLASKRLAGRLKMIQKVADRKASQQIISRLASATAKMVELLDADRPETARRACHDVIELARQAYRAQSKMEQREKQKRLPLYRRWPEQEESEDDWPVPPAEEARDRQRPWDDQPPRYDDEPRWYDDRRDDERDERADRAG